MLILNHFFKFGLYISFEMRYTPLRTTLGQLPNMWKSLTTIYTFMKFHLPLTVLTAFIAGGIANAETVTLEAGNYKNETEVQNTTFVGPDSGNAKFSNNLTATNCSFYGNLEFSNQKNLVLKGGNTFTAQSTQTINILSKTATAYGDNYFYGATNVNRLQVVSGTQTFKNTVTDNNQSMTFSGIGFAANADASAAINISANKGHVVFTNNCTVSSVEVTGASFKLLDTLIVKDSVTFGEGTIVEFADRTISDILKDSNGDVLRINTKGQYVNKLDPNTVQVWDATGTIVLETLTGDEAKLAYSGSAPAYVTTIVKPTLILEIDSIAELLDTPTTYTAREAVTTMFNIADGVDLGDNAKVELLFTENAINEIQEYDGPITLDLSKVTNASNIEVNFTIQDDLNMDAEEVFGTTSVTIGEAGSGNNLITLPVPEPTTATLSLLALVGLAGRRRRR